MPKKQTRRKKLPAYAHPSRHRQLHWKKIIYIVMFGAFGLVLVAAIIAQLFFNKYVNNSLHSISAFQMRTLIADAIDGLVDNMKSPDETARIKEARLQLPAETDEVQGIVYTHSPADKGYMEDGTTYEVPEMLQVTTRSLAKSGLSRLNPTDMNTLFRGVPEAQACTRGFLIYFAAQDDTGLPLAGTPKLQDGRTLYMYREDACRQYGMDELQGYLLQAQSY